LKPRTRTTFQQTWTLPWTVTRSDQEIAIMQPTWRGRSLCHQHFPRQKPRVSFPENRRLGRR
jgi:hypothetical protein